jgi:hypothetical protein
MVHLLDAVEAQGVLMQYRFFVRVREFQVLLQLVQFLLGARCDCASEPGPDWAPRTARLTSAPVRCDGLTRDEAGCVGDQPEHRPCVLVCRPEPSQGVS